MKLINPVVLDASALLALLNQEMGYEQVEKYLPTALMSAVNISEVVATYSKIGVSNHDIDILIHSLIKEIIPFDTAQAFIAGFLRKKTRPQGLSFGDRACLALAELKNLSVVTADKIWAKLDTKVRVILIR